MKDFQVSLYWIVKKCIVFSDYNAEVLLQNALTQTFDRMGRKGFQGLVSQ